MDELSSRRFSNSAWSSVLEGLSDLKGSIHGANIILCSGGYRVSIHESLVRKFTRVFNNLPEDLTEFKDENGFLVVILPDLNSQSLHALADFLYTGKAVFTPEDVRADLDQLLAPIIQVWPHTLKLFYAIENKGQLSKVMLYFLLFNRFRVPLSGCRRATSNPLTT